MSRVKELVIEIMRRYADTVEGTCIGLGEYLEKVGEYTVKCGKYLLAGVAVLLIYLVLAVTMPVWYLPYKFFAREEE